MDSVQPKTTLLVHQQFSIYNSREWQKYRFQWIDIYKKFFIKKTRYTASVYKSRKL